MAMEVAERREVEPVELKQWLDRGTARLVDVRGPDEYRRAHIAGAEPMPLDALDLAALKGDGSRRLVLLCQSGARSRQAVEAVLAAGVPEVWQLKGGLAAWQRAGLPVVQDAKAPLPIMRQVQIAAGSLILLGFLLGLLVAPAWHALSGLVGAGLIFAGITGRCGMASLLARLPMNRRGSAPAAAASCASPSRA
jgi:rhodanese-related sulfurtransferase